MSNNVPRVPFTPAEVEAALAEAIVDDARANGEFPWSDEEVDAFALRIRQKANMANQGLINEIELDWLLLSGATSATATRDSAAITASQWRLQDPRTKTLVQVLRWRDAWTVVLIARSVTGAGVLTVKFASGRLEKADFMLSGTERIGLPGAIDDPPVAVQLTFV